MKYCFMLILSLMIPQAFSGVVNTTPGTLQDKNKIKNYIEKEIPEIKNASISKKIILLRNFVYQRVKVGSAGNFKAEYEILLGIFNGKTPLLCGGISASYATLLQIYNIPVRLVQLKSAACVGTCYETHLATEVFLNNNWVVEDATFNIEWEYNNKIIGFISLKKLFNEHRNPQDKNNGFPIIQGRTIQEYYMPYKDLLAKMDFTEYQFWKSSFTNSDFIFEN